MPTRSVFCAWQISMVAALSQMTHIMTPVLNVRSADMVCEVLAAGRLRCAFMVLGHVVMVLSPAPPAGPAAASICKLGHCRPGGCDRHHRMGECVRSLPMRGKHPCFAARLA